MKKYRGLVPIVVIALIIGSWFVLVKDTVATQSKYNNYISEARKYAEDGITKYAIENYNLALSIKSTPEIYVEVADYYKKQGKDKEYLSWCENFFEEYPTSSKSYDCVLEAYLNEKDYESCYDILFTAEKRNISSEYIKKVAKDIEYVFEIDFNSYSNVGIYSNNFCAVESKDLWGFVDRFGNQRVSCKYVSVGAYTQSGNAPVVNSDNEAYFIDKTGSKVLVAKEKYKSFGIIVDNIIAAQKQNDKYTYVNGNFDELYGEYDFASTFNNGVAVVKNESQWSIVNSKGKIISDKKYVDVKIDEKEIAFRNERAFVALSEGKYIMIDTSGKQVGNLEFEDARVFASEGNTVVKINGKWQFIDKSGKLISDKSYSDARSFCNGLAAICVDGKWGFVNENEEVVIECQFFDAKDFNEKGSCFVKTGNKWQLLKLYRLNREA